MRSPATSTWDSIPDSEICARGVAHPSPEVNSGEQYSFSILGVPQISRFSRCGPRTEATDFPRSSETTDSDPCDRDEPHISQNTRERNTQEKNWRNHLNAECHYTASIGGRPAQPDRNPNYYVINTHITFDVQPFVPEQRRTWFNDHADGRRHRLLVADDPESGVLGYACTGRFRTKDAYDTTIEASVACRPGSTGRGLGKLLYSALFEAIAGEDINRVVAGIAQPNVASNTLHQRFGFKIVGTFSQAGRKFDTYWDVLWMERPLKLV